MTYFFTQTNTWNSQPQITDEQVRLWNHLAKKSNWRIVQLPNGFFQTEYRDVNCKCDTSKDHDCDQWFDVTRRETVEAAELAIDESIDHYANKIEFLKGPKVVKTF